MSHKIDSYRGIEIRYGYNIAIDGYTANFVLPEKKMMRVDFPHRVRANPRSGLKPGKNSVPGDTESQALDRARAAIDSYLDDE